MGLYAMNMEELREFAASLNVQPARSKAKTIKRIEFFLNNPEAGKTK